MLSEETKEAFLFWRGVEDPCPACGGSGVRVYGSTSTWRGGMGGSVCTSDVCDRCWGSGDVHKPWADLRKLHAEEEKRVAERALGLLLERAGLPLCFDADGSLDCYSASDEDRGCYSFGNWPSRFQEKRHERRRKARLRAENAKAGPWWIRYAGTYERTPVHWYVDGRGRAVASFTLEDR